MAAKVKKETPMIAQYRSMKAELPDDVLLCFRLGDFYEMFFEDAKEASPLLGVALTKRNDIPMCGFPHHAGEAYIGKIVRAGRRVALGEQVGDVTPGKLVKRQIAQVISAGTIDDLNLLQAKKHNYLAAVHREGKIYGLSFLDHTTGEFQCTEFSELSALSDELARIGPAETLFSDGLEDELGALLAEHGGVTSDGYTFLFDEAQHTLLRHFSVNSLQGFGCADLTAAIGAAGAILAYVGTVLHRSLDHILTLGSYRTGDFVLIDAATQRHLDLVSDRDGGKHTLLSAIDRTGTPMGARKLRGWILHPLLDLAALTARQDAIASFLSEPFILGQVADGLSRVRDIERTLGRLGQGSGNARDLQTLGLSLAEVPGLGDHLKALPKSGGTLLTALTKRLRPFQELIDELDEALVEEPPASLKEGGIFKDGYLPALDEIRVASTEGRKWIADLQASEAERTGIKSLKVKYNAVFGYFIEITKSNLANVPDDYTRKQTTANAERFITPELKEVESKVLGADERARTLEYDAFLKLRNRAVEHLAEIQDTADAVAEVDVLVGLAETARLQGYCRPLLDESRELHIKDGRHPVLDQHLVEEKFVPNDTHLEPELSRLVVLTGPNMAGKSTYIRQVALLTLLAQIGSYVPCAEMHLGLVDRIFTRVGASDDLARGQSTFMVEMNETALIINSATERSLVILDEIGRGTSTFDGLSIAWAVAEHLHDETQARTLFATHYHELCALASEREGAQNYNVAVREWNDEIVFLRKIIAGTADRSYGIQVARLAGLPASIIGRAKHILADLEGGGGIPNVPTPSAVPPEISEKPAAAAKKKIPSKAKTKPVASPIKEKTEEKPPEHSVQEEPPSPAPPEEPMEPQLSLF